MVTVAVFLSFATFSLPASPLVSTQQESIDIKGQEALARPSTEHEELAKLIGEWKVSCIGSSRTKTVRGFANAKTILGNRFSIIDGEAKILGRETEFRYTIGSDRRNKEYEITLMDTQGTYSVSGRGKIKGKTV